MNKQNNGHQANTKSADLLERYDLKEVIKRSHRGVSY